MFKIIFASALLAVTACCGSKNTGTGTSSYLSEGETKDSVPACVRKLIDAASKEEPPNTPMQVEVYLYKGKNVFLFTMPCCDQFNVVYDENCNRICAPTGGITGKGDMNCNDFSETAKLIKQVWNNAAPKK